jgi:hypothetical protein
MIDIEKQEMEKSTTSPGNNVRDITICNTNQSTWDLLWRPDYWAATGAIFLLSLSITSFGILNIFFLEEVFCQKGIAPPFVSEQNPTYPLRSHSAQGPSSNCNSTDISTSIRKIGICSLAIGAILSMDIVIFYCYSISARICIYRMTFITI